MGMRTATYSAMLKDRDYDVTPHIIAHIDSKCAGVLVKEWEVVWRWSAKSARCTVKMVGEEWPVGWGEVKTLVVVSSVTWSGDIWW